MTRDNEIPTAGDENFEGAQVPKRHRAWRRWILPLVVLVAALFLNFLAPRVPHVVERFYSRPVFPRIGHALTFVNRWFSFSLGECLVVILIALLVGAVVYQALRIFQTPRRAPQLLGESLRIAIWAVGSALLLFLMLWGLNYHREPLSTNLGLPKQTASDDQLEQISRSIVTNINANYDAVHAKAALDRAQLYNQIEAAYQRAPLIGALCRGGYSQPKPVRLSGIISWLGVSGVYMPFTGEANFNALQPDFDLPYVMAHEKAHQCGIAREDEANFVAFLVCSNSDNPFLRYSAYLNALGVVSELGKSDRERYRTVAGMLAAGPRADLTARAAFWARYQGRGMKVSHRINNSYLKANNVPGGTQSYSDDVALIISYYLQARKPDG
jgi:Protein of unknown function (DUF3810)